LHRKKQAIHASAELISDPPNVFFDKSLAKFSKPPMMRGREDIEKAFEVREEALYTNDSLQQFVPPIRGGSQDCSLNPAA